MWWPLLLAVLAVLIVLLLLLAVVWGRDRVRSRRRLDRVMNYGRPPKPLLEPALLTNSTWGWVRSIDTALAGRAGHRRAVLALDTAGVNLTPAAWYLLQVGAGLALAILLGLLLGSALLGVVLAVLVTVLVFRWVLTSRTSKRKKAFRDELPDFLLLIASGLRAGLSFISSLESGAAEGTSEVARQLRRALGEVQLGAQLEVALTECAERMDSEDLRWTVQALSIQREVGGNLSAILEATVETIKSRQALRREVVTLSAEGRLSAYVLIALPMGAFAFLFLFRRDYVAVLWSTAAGLTMLLLIGVLVLLGWFWMRSVVRIKV